MSSARRSTHRLGGPRRAQHDLCRQTTVRQKAMRAGRQGGVWRQGYDLALGTARADARSGTGRPRGNTAVSSGRRADRAVPYAWSGFVCLQEKWDTAIESAGPKSPELAGSMWRDLNQQAAECTAVSASASSHDVCLLGTSRLRSKGVGSGKTLCGRTVGQPCRLFRRSRPGRPGKEGRPKRASNLAGPRDRMFRSFPSPRPLRCRRERSRPRQTMRA